MLYNDNINCKAYSRTYLVMRLDTLLHEESLLKQPRRMTRRMREIERITTYLNGKTRYQAGRRTIDFPSKLNFLPSVR